MPELPEVEVTRLSFGDRIAGARITGVRMGKPLRWPLGCAPQSLVGWHVAGVRRRGKYLLVDLVPGQVETDRPGGGEDAVQGLLLIHLGMSGSLTFERQWPDAGAHDHFDLHTTHGLLRLHDPRRFGAVVYASSQDSAAAQKLLGKLGMEPLGDDFDTRLFHAGLAGRNTPVKQVLLAGTVVVGVGNIYASEALFMAGIRPTSRAGKLSRPRVARLHQAIRLVLARAVEKGGSTLRDFSNAKGESGYFQLEAMVYGRQGQPCKTCGAPIQAIRQGQRSTFFCAHCQKP